MYLKPMATYSSLFKPTQLKHHSAFTVMRDNGVGKPLYVHSVNRLEGHGVPVYVSSLAALKTTAQRGETERVGFPLGPNRKQFSFMKDFKVSKFWFHSDAEEKFLPYLIWSKDLNLGVPCPRSGPKPPGYTVSVSFWLSPLWSYEYSIYTKWNSTRRRGREGH